MADGVLNICKECVKLRVSKYNNSDHGKEIYSKWLKTPQGKAKSKRRLRRVRSLYPLKDKAHRDANRAVMNGVISKQPCEICGYPVAEKHHPNYSKPLLIRWLCVKHHRMLDKGKITLPDIGE
jgi:hypothetical protein